MDVLYTTTATATGGRQGSAATSDGRLKVALSHPVMKPRPETGTDPEQLFACAYAACYGGAGEYVCKQQGLPLSQPVQVTATVQLLKKGQTGPLVNFAIGVELHVELHGISQAQADEVIATAHTVCPYSNATRGNVAVMTTVQAVPAVA